MADTSFDDLDDFDSCPSSNAPDQRKKFPCMKCAGSGAVTFGYINPRSGKCFACNGRGYFLTSSKDRSKAKENYAAKKAKKGADNLLAFKEQKPEIYNWLNENGPKMEFAASLIDGIFKYGGLTEGQEKAVLKCMARQIEWEKEKAKPKEADAKLDLSSVFDKFKAAKESGLKRPKLRLDGFCFMPAPASGKNAGSIYVKAGPNYEDTYLGKISGDGEFFKSRDCDEPMVEKLKEISKDVLAAAVAYGRMTGNCACCGRELTNKESVEMGIGPICASKWSM